MELKRSILRIGRTRYFSPMSHRNVERLLHAFEVGPDDPEAFYAIFDPEVEWDASHTGLPEFAEPRRGIEVVRYRGSPTKREALSALDPPERP
jgi:hypothetical protein